jgi:hypothetical protein
MMHRRKIQRQQLRLDGLKAHALIDTGLKPADVLLVVGGSRARLYRALKTVESETQSTDPLLL